MGVCMNPEARQLPHSIEAEQALLGAILLNPDALDVVDGKVSAADFFEPFHAALYRLPSNSSR